MVQDIVYIVIIKWSGEDCNLCHGKSDSPQCNTQYQPIDCLDPINGKYIRGMSIHV